MTTEEMREVDTWIAEHVFDFAWIPSVGKTFYLVSPGDWQAYKPEFVQRGLKLSHANIVAERRVPFYTTDPAAAMDVLKKCAEKRAEAYDPHRPSTYDPYRPSASLVICAPCCDRSQWTVVDSEEMQIFGEAETLELAICLFAKHLFTPPKPLITKRETD
jgi:hypothetical protein